MKEYHKIQTVFKRDPATKHKTLLEGDYSLPAFEYLRDNQWVFTEKVDGTNIRVMVNGSVSFGGKTDNAQIPSHLAERLRTMFDPQQDKLREMFADGACLYGEGYGAKIQKGGGNYSATQDFVLFDVLATTVNYASIEACPRHRNLLYATLVDLTSLKGFVNPAIIGTLKRRILSGLTTSGGEPQSIESQKKAGPQFGSQPENATSKQSLESVSTNTTPCLESKKGRAQYAESKTPIGGAEGLSSLSPLTTATIQEKFEDFYALAAMLESTKRNEIVSGLMQPECICKVGSWWLERANIEDIAGKLGLRVAPIIGEGTLAEMVEQARGGIKSQWGDFSAEGIVARPKCELVTRNGERIITKIKTRDFTPSEPHAAVFGGVRSGASRNTTAQESNVLMSDGASNER